MNDEANYSKREHDAFRAENKRQYESIISTQQAQHDAMMEAIGELKQQNTEIKQTATLNNKVVSDLCRVVSNNSGDITELQTAHRLIKDITTVWTAGKWFVYFIIGTSALIVAIKTIITVGIKDGMEALKNLIF